MKFKFLDLLLFALLFIFVNAFPTDLLPLTSIGQLILRISLRVLLLSYYIYTLCRYRINIFKFANYKRAALFIPFVLICFSNIIAAGIAGSEFTLNVDLPYLLLLIVFHLLGAVIEEFLFRLFIQNSLVYASSLKRIFFSALIFALFHLLNIVNVSSVDMLISVLTQVVYAFGLGFLLAVIYEYSYSLPLCITFHFMFNFFNTIFVTNIYSLSIDPFIFYMTAIVCGVVVGLYFIFIYLFVLRKNERYFRQ